MKKREELKLFLLLLSQHPELPLAICFVFWLVSLADESTHSSGLIGLSSRGGGVKVLVSKSVTYRV